VKGWLELFCHPFKFLLIFTFLVKICYSLVYSFLIFYQEMGYFVWINSNVSNKYTYEQTEMDCDRGIIVPFFGGWGSRKRLGEICQYPARTNSSFELSRGNTYPAVAMPWGMNFWTPQTGENRNGFIYRYAEDIIRGFRQTHQCSPWANDYAAFSLMPVSGELKVTQHNRFRHFRHEDEIAQPHYYKVTLDNRITAEMSPTERGYLCVLPIPKGKMPMWCWT